MRRDLLEDEGNTDRWMISYADFITLLFAFFVVMYSISSVNNEKYRVLSDTLARAFEAKPSSLDPIQVGEPLRAASPHIVDIPDTEGWADDHEGDTFVKDVEQFESLHGGFAEQAGVAVEVDNDWLEISLNANILFAQGGAGLSTSAEQSLDPVLELLLKNGNPITIEGYTDNVVPNGTRYLSNWELSGARAAAVARVLVEGGVRQRRIAVIGYGENHPIATNATPNGRASNRRVTIVVARQADNARNRNVGVEAIVSQVRESDEVEIQERRTASGGLLFTNEEPAISGLGEETQ